MILLAGGLALTAPGSADVPVAVAGLDVRAVLVAAEGLDEPFGVDFDAKGNAYIVEMGANRISVLPPGGRPRLLAGTGEKGLSGDGGAAARARFNGPHHLLLGPDGGLYVADTWNNGIRRIDLRTGLVALVAGTGEKGYIGRRGPRSRGALWRRLQPRLPGERALRL